MERYVVMTQRDGDVRLEELDRQELLSRLESNYYGKDAHFLDRIAGIEDLMYWPERSILIIKGEVVVPKVVMRVTKYDLD